MDSARKPAPAAAPPGALAARAFELAANALPVLRWLPSYDWRRRLLGDVVAGLTVTAVAAPEAVSYAAIAGLPAQQGLYTGFLGPLAYAATGSSPQLIVGPTAIMCILTMNAVPSVWGGAPVEPPGAKAGVYSELRVELAALLALAVAALQLAMAALRLGGLVGLVSTPVVAGFTTGSALLTASSQFATLLGMPKCVGASGGSCTFVEALSYTVNKSALIQGNVCLMSLVCLAVLLAFKYGPAALRLPKPFLILANLAPLALVVITVPLVVAVGAELDRWGLDAPKAIPAGLPSPFLPFGAGSLTRTGSRADVLALFGAAAPLAIIGYMGAVTIGKTAARQNGPYAVDSAQELWAQVACNAACGIGRGLPVTGSFSRTAVNASSGATTGVASLLTSLLMAAALVALSDTLSKVPSVARAAIVIVAILKMVELHLLAELWRSDKRDLLVFAATFLVTITVDSSTGLAAGVAAQWLLALTRSAAAPSDVALYAFAPGGEWTRMRPAGSASPRGIGAGGDSSSSTGESGSGASTGRDSAAAFEGSGASAATHATAAANAPAGSAMPPGGCAVLGFAPDLQFGSAERVRAHVEECVAVYAPRALVLDCARVAAADSTGAAALLGVAADVAARGDCVLVACALGAREAALLVAAAAAAAAAAGGAKAKKGAGGGGGGAAAAGSEGAAGAGAGAGPLPPGAAAEAGVEAICAGALVIVRDTAAADALARVLCAGARAHFALRRAPAPAPAAASLNSAVGQFELAVPLIEGGDAEGGAEDAGSGSGGGGGGGIAGVPLSPLAQARQALRRGRLPLSGGGGAAAEDEEEAAWRALLAGAAPAAAGAERAPLAERAAGELRGAARDALALLDDTRPMLRVV